MRDHSTIGLVITTDGSIGELPRSNYLGAEEKTILALKKSGKPFLVLVNSQKPYSEETRKVAEEIGSKYDVSVMPVNCEQLKKEDIHRILEKILYEFPLTAVEFYFPKWMDMLPIDHAVKQDLLKQIRFLQNTGSRKDYRREAKDLKALSARERKKALNQVSGALKTHYNNLQLYL